MRDVTVRKLPHGADLAFDKSRNSLIVELGVDQSDRDLPIRRLIASLVDRAQDPASNLTFDNVPAPQHLPDIQTHRTTPLAKAWNSGISHDCTCGSFIIDNYLNRGRSVRPAFQCSTLLRTSTYRIRCAPLRGRPLHSAALFRNCQC